MMARSMQANYEGQCASKLMWVIIIDRVLGYCVKNYYMVNRQAVKRTTTYAGNHAAFSAELANAEMLKKKQCRRLFAFHQYHLHPARIGVKMQHAFPG
jgi:hypothetical protein